MVRERMRVERECVRDVRDVYDMSYVLVNDYQQEHTRRSLLRPLRVDASYAEQENTHLQFLKIVFVLLGDAIRRLAVKRERNCGHE